VREDLFEVITERGSLPDAKRRAKRMYEEYIGSGVTAPSAMYPATRMFELVEELETFLM
jgi:hypothetical protein